MTTAPFACACAVLLPVFLAAAEDTPNEQLRLYYRENKQPPWREAMQRLSGGADADFRRQAATYLKALLAQALADEESGAAPWRATPFWGSSGENPARNLRAAVAEELGKAKLPAEAVPLVSWFIRGDKSPKSAHQAAEALAKIASPEADALLLELASQPHPNIAVAVAAIKEAAARKLALPAERWASLAQHHRKDVRDAARGGAALLQIAVPAGFDPARAVQSEAIRGLMARLTEIIPDPAPADAGFVTATHTWYGKAGEKEHEQVERGWVVEAKGGKAVIVTPFGRRRTLELRDKPKADGDDRSPWTCIIAKTPIADEVKRVTELRKAGDPEFDLSEQGGLTGQFQGRGAGLYEALLAEWLFRAKRFDLCAAVLLPALDTLYDDEHLLLIARDRLGQMIGYRMLVAFVGERDYAEALRIAERLLKTYPGSPLEHYAKALAEQLPKRMEDFKTLKLPTPAEWTEMKTRLNRRDQIDFLAKRMRLLNGYQHGQPGGVNLEEEQYAEPGGLSENAAWGGGERKTKLINPLVELDALQPAIADIPQLAEFLREDWFMLAVGYWRDFHPNRTLQRTRPLFASMINGIAKQELIPSRDEPGAKELDAAIAAAAKWAKENGGKSEADLLIAALEKALREGESWYHIERQAGKLVELKTKAAAPVMLKFLDAPKTNEFNIESILSCCRRLDGAAAAAAAPRYLNHEKGGVRLEAAFCLVGGPRGAEAVKVIGDVLAGANQSNLFPGQLPEAAGLLLKAGTPEAKAQAVRVFSGDGLAGFLAGFDRRQAFEVVRMVSAAGLPDGWRFLIRVLDIKGNSLGGSTWGQPVAQVVAEAIINDFDPNDADLSKIARETKDKPEDAVKRVRAWVAARLEKMGAKP